MSRSEMAQSIDESTQGKVTHRQGDFNWKLGNRRVPKSQTNSIFTIVYTIERRGKLLSYPVRSVLLGRRIARTYTSTRSCGSTAAQQAAPAR